MTNSKYNWENESDKISKRLVSQDEEEFLSKRRARELFDNKILKNSLKVCYYRVAEEFAN